MLKNITKKSVTALLLSIILLLAGCTLVINSTEAGPTATAVFNQKMNPEWEAGLLIVHYIDVGKADCIFMQLPNGQNMIIDAGNNDDANLVCSYLKNLNVKKIDYAVGTHPHEDHIGGLDIVIKTFDIGKIYLPNKSHTTQTFEDLLLAIKEKGLTVTNAKASVNILNAQGIKIELIGPVKAYDDLNNSSAVIRISYAGIILLFAGDAENDALDDIMKAGYSVKCDILKVSHHGSSDSTSKNFLDSAMPLYAIISTGTDFTPAESTLKHLNSIKAKILRTDLMGTIKFYINTKGDIAFKTEKNG